MNQYLHNKTFQNLSTLCAKRLKKRSRQSFPPLWEISHIALFEFTLCFMSMTSYPLFCPTRHRGLGLKFARWKPSQTIRTRVFTLYLRVQTGYTFFFYKQIYFTSRARSCLVITTIFTLKVAQQFLRKFSMNIRQQPVHH